MATRRLFLIGALPPLMLFTLNTFVFRRSFFLYGVDDTAFYYLARVAEAGLPLDAAFHPAIPVIFMGRVLLGLVGTGVEGVQSFVTLSHLVAALATSVALGAFVVFVSKRAGTAVIALTVGVVLAWPPFLTFSDYLGPDAFIVAAGLPMLVALWRALSKPEDSKRAFFWHGILLGTCLSLKLSFLPLAIVCVVVWIVFRVTERRSIVPAIVGTALSLVLFVPVLPWLPQMLRSSVLVGAGGVARIARVPELLWYLATHAPLFLVAALTTSFLVLKGGGSNRAKIVLVRSMVALFWLSIASSTDQLKWSADAGVVLRYASPAALVFPFAIVLLAESPDGSRWRTTNRRRILAAFAVAMVAAGATTYFDMRSSRVDLERTAERTLYERMDALAGPIGTIAFFQEVNAISGEPAFHLRGDDMTGNHFEDELLRTMPRFVSFRLDDAQNTIAGDTFIRDGFLPRFSRAWRDFFGGDEKRDPEIINGITTGLRPRLIAFPRNGEQFLDDEDLDAVVDILVGYLGPLEEMHETWFGYEWVFLTPRT